jgi:hypothetical protein
MTTPAPIDHRAWNRMSDEQRMEVVKSRLPSTPTPSIAIVPPPPPKPLTERVGGIEIEVGGDTLRLSTTVLTTVPSAAVQVARSQAVAEIRTRLESLVKADERVARTTTRLEALQALEVKTRADHAKATGEAEAALKASREALHHAKDPSAAEAARDAAAALRERLGIRLGELADLIRRADQEAFEASLAANRDVRQALRAELSPQWMEASKGLCELLAAKAAELVALQAVLTVGLA